MPSGLFSLRLTFERSKSESLRDVSVTRMGDTFSQGFRRLNNFHRFCEVIRLMFYIMPCRTTFGTVCNISELLISKCPEVLYGVLAELKN